MLGDKQMQAAASQLRREEEKFELPTYTGTRVKNRLLDRIKYCRRWLWCSCCCLSTRVGICTFNPLCTFLTTFKLSLSFFHSLTFRVHSSRLLHLPSTTAQVIWLNFNSEMVEYIPTKTPLEPSTFMALWVREEEC